MPKIFTIGFSGKSRRLYGRAERSAHACRVLNEIMDVAPNEIYTEYDEYDHAVCGNNSVPPKKQKSPPSGGGIIYMLEQWPG